MENETQTTATDNGGQSPSLSDNDRHSPTRSDKHTLNTAEVVRRFEDAGLPRSQRSIERYCKSGKLDCFSDPDESRYYATPGSVDRLIGQLRELQARHGTAVGHRPTAENGPQNQRVQGEGDGNQTKKLEDEVLNLQIDNRAKEQVIVHLKDQMQQDRQLLVEQSRQIGVLETEVRQLQAPQREDVDERQIKDVEADAAESRPSSI